MSFSNLIKRRFCDGRLVMIAEAENVFAASAGPVNEGSGALAERTRGGIEECRRGRNPGKW
jgi:hypothetical protein